MLKKIHSFKLKPTVIIETRNGIHVYWKVNDCKVEDFEPLQKRMIQYFKSDEKVHDLSRVMRLPNYYWTKDINNNFLCNVIEHNDTEYNIHDFDNLLPPIINKKDNKENKSTTNHKKATLDKPNINVNEYPSTNIEYIKKKDWKGLNKLIFNKYNDNEDTSTPIYKSMTLIPNNGGTSILQIPVKVFNFKKDVYDYLYQQDLREYLGVSGNYIDCVIHNDKNKSASIFQTDQGNYMYKCFSSNCKFGSGNINKLTEALTGLNRPDTLEFLMKVYNIEIIKTDWQKEQEKILESNIDLLLDMNYFKSHYPELYRRINKYIPQLIILHEYAKRNICLEQILDDKDTVAFTAPIRSISNEIMKIGANSDPKAIKKRNNILVFIGLLTKLGDDIIPKEKLDQVKEYATNMGYKNFVNFYSLPSYDYNTLNYATDKSIEFTEKNMTVKGFSREMLLRTFGEEEANRVYPRQEGKSIYEGNDRIIMILKQAALNIICEKGWVLEKEILENEHVDNEIKSELGLKDNKKIFKQRKTKLWKICLQEFLDEYILERRKLNKKLIERFSIKGIKGYPYIIYKN